MDYKAEYERLHALLNRPEVNDFIEGVRSEAAHQVTRWEAADRQKNPEDWYWTLGYLAGKALKAQRDDDIPMMLHHLISSAALLANWHSNAKVP